MREDGRIEIRSFRVVFELERRLHRIDRWRIPVPYGIPLRGIAYGLAALAAVVVAQRLPVGGEALRLLPPPLRLVVLPVGIAYALTRLHVDGRSAHAALLALGRWWLAPRVIAGFRSVPAASSLGELVLVTDERCTSYRRAVVRGPATVLLRFPARARARARRIVVRQASDRPMLRGKELRLGPGQRLEVR